MVFGTTLAQPTDFYSLLKQDTFADPSDHVSRLLQYMIIYGQFHKDFCYFPCKVKSQPDIYLFRDWLSMF